MSLLTTITPVWNRPDALKAWLGAITLAAVDEVHHLLICVGEKRPPWLPMMPSWLTMIERPESPGKSIGHYHNLGAQMVGSEWIMKLDIDTMPNERYWDDLLGILRGAGDREWFNGGMLYLNRAASSMIGERGVTERIYQTIMNQPKAYVSNSYLLPAATNFICRREDYLSLGGCDDRFAGYGWEDYQQIYMLEQYHRGADPLPGVVTVQNVTQRCRDEISRPKARRLWERNQWLCLMHRWHPRAVGVNYRANVEANRRVLFEHVQKARS